MKKLFLIPLFLTILSSQAADVIGGVDIPNISTPKCMEIKNSPFGIYPSPNKAVIGSCYGNIYEVSGKTIKLPNGRKVYPAHMLEDLEPLYKQLPIHTYIPVYSQNGKWNGFYYSRGC